MIKYLIPTLDQVREFLREESFFYTWLEISTFSSDGFVTACVRIEEPDGSMMVLDHYEDRYVEILKKQTTFWHAWQMMKEGAIFECTNKGGEFEPGYYTVIDDVLHTKFESPWVRWDITDNLTAGKWFFTGKIRQLGEENEQV